jgi:perosamine synthetase
MRLDLEAAVAAIESVLPPRRPIEHHEPYFNGAEQYHTRDCLEKDPVGYDYIDLMEGKLRELTQQDCFVVSSGTAALELVLRAAGIGPGDEVLVPALTFVGTANAVSHTGATPNFVDGGLRGVNAYKLRRYLERTTHANGRHRINTKTERPIKALIAVHLLGTPCYIHELQQVADENGMLLIEDAAEAVGSQINNRPCGSFGQAGIFSFNCNKIVTTGGGGAVISSDPWVIARAYQLATTARLSHPWRVEHDAIAWNYRLQNIAAAVGYAQLGQLPTFLYLKRVLADRYQQALNGTGLEFVPPVEGANCWLSAALVPAKQHRDLLLQALFEKGIHARAIFTPLHKLPMYEKHPQDNLGYSEDIAARLVCLPSGTKLGYENPVD